jgi:stage V sporulation protein SpoVS
VAALRLWKVSPEICVMQVFGDVATALRSRRRRTPHMLGSNFDSQAVKYVTIASSKPVEMDRFDIVLLIVYILLTSLVLRKRFVLQH